MTESTLNALNVSETDAKRREALKLTGRCKLIDNVETGGLFFLLAAVLLTLSQLLAFKLMTVMLRLV